MLAALFPPDHPYHWTTIGEIADLHAVQLDEVHAFFRALLPPGERVARARRRHRSRRARWRSSRDYFERDRRRRARRAGRAPTRRSPRDVRIQLEDRVELPRLYLAWLSPAMFAEGDADLDLAADLLANGKTSRLYRRLVFEERIATDVSASQNSREIGGYAADHGDRRARPHARRARARRSSRRSRGSAADGPTDDEIERGRVQAEAQFMFRLQTVGGFGGKSDQLNAYNVVPRRPGVLRPRSRALPGGDGGVAAAGRRPLSRSGATGDAQHRAARPRRARRARLGAGGRVVTRRPLAARPSQAPSARRSRFPPSRSRRCRTACACGRVRHAQVPVVAFMLLVRRGAASDPPGKDGLAAMTADMLDEGSGDRSAIEMHEALARLGAQFDTDIGSDATRGRASPC